MSTCAIGRIQGAALCCLSALAVTAISSKTPREPSTSHERHEAGYRQLQLDQWSSGAILERDLKLSAPKLR